MRLSVCSHDVPGLHEEKLKWLSEHGFDGIQVWQRELDAEGLSAGELLALCRKHGVEVSAVGGGPNLVDPSCASDSISLFQRFLDLAVDLGPRIVTAETKAMPAGMGDEEAWRSTVSTVAVICRYAERVGAVLAIEPSGSCFVSDQDMWQALARAVDSPSLKVNYDPANIVAAGRDPVEAARALGADIVHTHAKDFPADWQALDHQVNVPAGEGVVDYPAYLAALRDCGYTGYLTVEMHAGATDRREDVWRAARNLRAMLVSEG